MSRSSKAVAPLVAIALLGTLAFASSASAAGGTGLAWGYNYYGQVGDGTPPKTDVLSPKPIVGASGIVQISQGPYHALSLDANGTVKGWGYNNYGQATNGSGEDEVLVPTAVGGLGPNVIAVSAGTHHSLVLLSNGTVMAWGYNVNGQLGLGSTVGPEECEVGYGCSKKPLLVPGLANVIAISAGYDFNLALLADGTVVAWGYDYSGELGGGIPHQTGCDCIDHPVAVPGVSDAMSVGAGESNGSAVLGDGTVRTWGSNYYGQIGNGTNLLGPTCQCTGVQTVSGIGTAKTVDPGGYHMIAALGDGSVRAWGWNGHGQLGIGTNSGPETCATDPCSKVPVMVPGVSGAQSIGSNYSANIVLSGDGTARAWGFNSYGEVGDGTDTERTSPVPVGGLSAISSITAGENNSGAISGPAQALSVALAGAGSGHVGTAGLNCPIANCSEKLSQDQTRILRASSTAGGFAGFSGPCTGTGTCQVRMDTDQAVTATFGVPKGTAITKSDVNSKKKKATFTFTAPGAITGYECKLIKPKPRKKGKGKGGKGKGGKSRVVLAKKGAKKPKPVKFSACTGPAAYKNLKPGKYTFEVRALDILGADATPAVKKFTVKKPKPKKHKKGK